LTALQIDTQLRKARVIAVTSPGRGTGSSEVASALALALANAGHKTLLIDFDLKQSSITQAWCKPEGFISDQSGVALSSLLLGGAFEPKTLQTPMARLSFVKNDLGVHRATLDYAALTGLFSEVCQAFEMVIVDTAPPVECLETVLICQAAETVLLCVDSETKDPDVHDCINRMKAAEVSLGGVVFNRAADCDLKLTPSREVPALAQSSAPCPPGALIQAIRAA
jgi:Mrp family chromosome partitioning ATPase